MNKENIIDYVTQTPHNPNKKVLDDMLETLIEENGTGGVGECDWNTLKNRPFGEEVVFGDTLTWDGNIEGRVTTIDSSNKTFVKVSNATPKNDDSIEAKILISNQLDDVLKAYKNPYGSVDNYGGFVFVVFEDYAKYIIESDYGNYDVTFPEKGTYFIACDDNLGIEHVAEFQMPEFNGFERTEIVTIDPKYIKDMYYESEPVKTVIVEETTFELVDGLNQITALQPLEVGQEYVVTLDGTSYNCVAKLVEQVGLPYLGNIELADFGEDTGEPFFIAPVDEINLGIIINNEALEHTVSVVGMIRDIHQINPKYIKDMYYEYIGPNNDIILNARFIVEEDFQQYSCNDFALDNFLVEGATYRVNYNDETYICTARRNNDGEIYIGNQAVCDDEWLFPEIIESNEPFYLYTFEKDFDYGIKIQTAGEYSIFIVGTGEKLTAKTIDYKYIPNNIKDSIRNQRNEIDNLYDELYNNSNFMSSYNPTGSGSFSMNRKSGTTIGDYSHAEGRSTTASGDYSHAEGRDTSALGRSQNVSGEFNIPETKYINRQQVLTQVEKVCNSTESGNLYTALSYTYDANTGLYTLDKKTLITGVRTNERYYIYGGESGTTMYHQPEYTGLYNTGSVINATDGVIKYTSRDISVKKGDYVHIVGNGTSDTERSNAHTLDWDGNAWFAGDVYVGSTSGTNKDDGSKKLASEEYVDNAVANAGGSSSGILIAEFNSTTHAEIVEAVNNGKLVVARRNNIVYNMSSYEADWNIEFEAIRGENVKKLSVTIDNVWTPDAVDLKYDFICTSEYTLTTTNKTIEGAINELNAKHTEGTNALILLSPNGTRFNITVGDDGVLSATEMTE